MKKIKQLDKPSNDFFTILIFCLCFQPVFYFIYLFCFFLFFFCIGTISRSTLKPKDKQKVDRTISTESLHNSRNPKNNNGTSRVELNRSTSVPRDPNKSAGWFKIKSKKSRAC